MHVSKVDLLNFEIPCFHDILLMVSDPLVLYFGSNLMHMGPYGCIRMHMEAYGCIWKLFSLIFIGFPSFQEDSEPAGLVGARNLGSLLHPVGPCGNLWRPIPDLSYPFKMMQ